MEQLTDAEASVRALLERFACRQGFFEAPLATPLVEAFCSLGLAQARSSTRGTYRSRLRRIGGLVRPKKAPSFPGAPAPPPYTGTERAELYAACCAQSRPWRREAALALLALGLSAGLRKAELVAAVGSAVSEDSAGVVLRVGGLHPRRIVCRPPLDALVVEQATRVGKDHLFHPGEARRDYKNFVNDFCAHVVVTPPLSLSRCRASFVCDHLAAGTPLTKLLAAAGIAEVESLLRYAHQVAGAPTSKAALRRRLREQAPAR